MRKNREGGESNFRFHIHTIKIQVNSLKMYLCSHFLNKSLLCAFHVPSPVLLIVSNDFYDQFLPFYIQQLVSGILWVFFFLRFIYLFMSVGLDCCDLFCSWGEQGMPFHCGAQAAHAVASFVAKYKLPGGWASVVLVCGPQSRLSCHGVRAELSHGMWDLPRSGIEPASPALAGGFSATGPPERSSFLESGLLR